MKVGSLFSGIGGLDLGLEWAGMEVRWQVEIDAACRSVLRRHWPDTELHGDVVDVGRPALTPVDIISGGFPCQDLSVAGRRAGLAGERSGLWFEFHRIVAEMRPRWVLIENVPGLLSSNGGRDFAVIVHGLVELGYRVEWRVLDSRYFGVAQRRRRVFVVGCLGSPSRLPVLLEPKGVRGDSPPSREAGRGASIDVLRSSLAAGGPDDNRHGPDGKSLNVVAFNATQDPISNDRCFGALSEQGAAVYAYDSYNQTISKNISPAIYTGTRGVNESGVLVFGGPRRLTPRECERLQGFPDDWTRWAADGKEMANSPRYRMLGNAVTVSVAQWIGERIMSAEAA